MRKITGILGVVLLVAFAAFAAGQGAPPALPAGAKTFELDPNEAAAWAWYLTESGKLNALAQRMLDSSKKARGLKQDDKLYYEGTRNCLVLLAPDAAPVGSK